MCLDLTMNICNNFHIIKHLKITLNNKHLKQYRFHYFLNFSVQILQGRKLLLW